MKSKHCFKHFAAALACLMLCVLCMPQAAFAKGYDVLPDVDAKCSFSLGYSLNGKPVPGVDFYVYKVADMNKNVQLVLTENFKNLELMRGADANDLPRSTGTNDWAALAGILANYCSPGMADRIETTDKGGKVSFENMDMGLYLFVGSRHLDPNQGPNEPEIYYCPVPFLVALPNWSEERNEWVYEYDVTSKPKQSNTPARVLKVWDDEGYEAQRPESITVQVVGDGVVYSVVTLKENRWAADLVNIPWDECAVWTIQEVGVPSNYRLTRNVTIGITTVITNKYTPPTPPYIPETPSPTPSPDPSSSPSPDPSPSPTPDVEIPPPDVPQVELPPIEIDDPDVPLAEPDDPIEIDDPDVPLANLPQTGQLWWPVPVLAAAGVMMFLFGLKRRSRGKDEK